MNIGFKNFFFSNWQLLITAHVQNVNSSKWSLHIVFNVNSENLVFQSTTHGQNVNSYYGFSHVFLNANSANLVFPDGNSSVHPMFNTCILIAGFLVLFLKVNSENLFFESGNSQVHPLLKMNIVTWSSHIVVNINFEGEGER